MHLCAIKDVLWNQDDAPPDTHWSGHLPDVSARIKMTSLESGFGQGATKKMFDVRQRYRGQSNSGVLLVFQYRFGTTRTHNRSPFLNH
jgi:hypothetical protein